MIFYLRYDGLLKASDKGKVKDKHEIREYFRPQMERLWDTIPLNGYKSFLEYPPDPSGVSVVKEIEGVRFAPLVTTAICMNCELDITLLWKDEPGNMINRGDIDNRLKTLFDALSCPNKAQMKGCKDSISKSQPYHVLLEDDKLITAVRVETNRLLLPKTKPDDVSLLIRVKTRLYKGMIKTIGL